MSSTRKETKSAVSSRRALRGTKSAPRIVRYTREELENLKDESDWARVDAMTDAEIEATALADPDYAEFVDIDWSKAELVHPTRKKPISIRLDEDIIAYFKKMGRGYQTRINAVLRSYMDHNIRDEG